MFKQKDCKLLKYAPKGTLLLFTYFGEIKTVNKILNPITAGSLVPPDVFADNSKDNWTLEPPSSPLPILYKGVSA